LFVVSSRKTELSWLQEFESSEVLEQLRPICEPANEQNLDRLEVILRGDVPAE
jgi:hypothetical protein